MLILIPPTKYCWGTALSTGVQSCYTALSELIILFPHSTCKIRHITSPYCNWEILGGKKRLRVECYTMNINLDRFVEIIWGDWATNELWSLQRQPGGFFFQWIIINNTRLLISLNLNNSTQMYWTALSVLVHLFSLWARHSKPKQK